MSCAAANVGVERSIPTAARPPAAEATPWSDRHDRFTPNCGAPPPLAPDGAYDFTTDARYAGQVIPDTESLKTTLDRVEPYWSAHIAPRLRARETVLVAAHGNSLRAIVKLLFAVPDDKIVAVEIPTGNPLLIQLDADLQPISARYLDADRATPLPVL